MVNLLFWHKIVAACAIVSGQHCKADLPNTAITLIEQSYILQQYAITKI